MRIQNRDCPLDLFPPLADLPDDERAIAAEVVTLAKAQAEGLGDTLKNAIEALGLDRAAKLLEKLTHKKCRCDARRKWLNKVWPYRSHTE